MKRRAVLALSGLAAIGGCLEGDGADDSPNNSSDAESEAEASTLPIDVRTVDAPGSDAGTEPVPRDGQVTVLNFTRLLCPTSEGLIGTIGDVAGDLEATHEVGSTGDVRFLSVVDPEFGPDPSDEELAEWWDEHDGRWSIGLDEDSTLTDYYEVESVPTIVVIDGDGEVHWRQTGGTSSTRIRAGVERALEAEPGVAESTTDADETSDDSGE